RDPRLRGVHAEPRSAASVSRLRKRLISSIRIRAVVEGQQRGSVHVVELIVVDGPEESRRGADEQQQRQWNHDQQNVHAASAMWATRAPPAGTATPASKLESSRPTRPIRMALSTTTSELNDMPSAASHGGTKPSAA